VGFLTLTYGTWSDKRRRYREENQVQAEEARNQEKAAKQEEEREEKVASQRSSLQKRSVQAVRRANELLLKAQGLEVEARLLLESEDVPEHSDTRKEVESCIAQITDLSAEDPALSSRLDDVSDISDMAELRVVGAAIERDAVLQFRRLGSSMDRLRNSMESLKRQREREEIGVRKGKDLRCCIACGSETPLSSYCPRCGILQPLELMCDRCGELYRYPVHLISPDKAGEKVHCMACGKELETGLVERTSKTGSN